jgi:hypothetical protein
MSEFKRARVYALDKIGPINVGAGNNDYICKVFAETPEGHHVVVQVSTDSYEGYAKALIDGARAEVVLDPSKVLSIQTNRQAATQSVNDAIAETRAKSVRTT